MAGPVAHPPGRPPPQLNRFVGVGIGHRIGIGIGHCAPVVGRGPDFDRTQSSSYTVGSRHFTVTVATSGNCWVQVTSSSSATPLVSGVQPAGKVLSFPAKGTMTVQVGASAVVVGVAINGKAAFINAPHATPYTYTFATAST